jgi:hypothetical protein
MTTSTTPINKTITKKYKDWQKKRADQPKDFSFDYGKQDATDIISYSGLEEQQDYLVVDGVYMRTLFISGYPFVASSGWLNSLITFNHNVDISYHISQVPATSALPKLHRKITELESTKRAMVRAGKIVGPEITDPLESAMELRDKIQRGQEMLFQISIYICVSASSLDELDKTTKLLENTMGARLFFTKTARYQQLEAMQSILPRGEDTLSQKRNLDSSSASLTFPFMSSELVQESGILYGVNKSNNSLVILDRFSLHNANSIVFAQSGSGKSYATKVEILRQLMQGTSVIVIDPEREYKLLSDSVEGELDDEIIEINNIGKHDVYDITVAETHRYSAQGFVNHNSFVDYNVMARIGMPDCGIVEYADHKARVLGGKTSQNPYKLGFELLLYIEDKWNKGRFGKDYEQCEDNKKKEEWDLKLGLGHQKVFEVREKYNDVTLIHEFFDQEFCDKFKFYEWKKFPSHQPGVEWEYKIVSRDAKKIKNLLMQRYLNGGLPDIRLVDYNGRGKGIMVLEHQWDGRMLLPKYTTEVIKNAAKIWGNPVALITKNKNEQEIVYVARPDSDKVEEMKGKDYKEL